MVIWGFEFVNGDVMVVEGRQWRSVRGGRLLGEGWEWWFVVGVGMLVTGRIFIIIFLLLAAYRERKGNKKTETRPALQMNDEVI